MARKTMTKKLDGERKKYEADLKKLGEGMQRAMVKLIAPLIPKGWYLAWEQKDDCYNDEDYYFDIESRALNSELKPRKGKLLKEERPRTTKMVDELDYYTRKPTGRQYEQVDDYGAPAEHEWHLDEKCKTRKSVEFYAEMHEDPGVVALHGDEESPLLDESEYSDLVDVLEGIDKADYRRAFGDNATVVVRRNGTYEVK